MKILTALRSVTTLAAFVMPVMAIAQNAPSSWEFGAWSMVCDNTNHCEAAAVRADDDPLSPSAVTLRISRDAGPGTATIGRIFFGAGDTLRLRVRGGVFENLSSNADLPADIFHRMLPLLLRAESADLITSDGVYKLPLSGLKATLLKMDDVQGRNGTGGALIRSGSLSERHVPPALPAPVVRTVWLVAPLSSDGQLVDVLTQRLAPDCGDDASPRELGGGAVRRVSSTKVLFLFACSEPSANQSFSIWLVDDHAPYGAKHLQFFRPGDVDVGSLFNAEFDGQILTSTTYGSTTHQCWSKDSWAWTGVGFDRVEEDGAACPDANGVSFRFWTASILSGG